MKKLQFVLSGVLFLMLSGCHSTYVSKIETNQTYLQGSLFNEARWQTTQAIYTPNDWPQALDVEVIHPAPELQDLPIMLLVHGGGWQRRSSEDMQSLARYWAKKGFITVNVAYRFAPEYQFPAQLHDVQKAMHWIHSQRSVWNTEHSPVVALGFSSGAHLVSLMASVASQGNSLDLPYGGPVTRPDVIIAGGTPSDLQKWDSGRLIEDFLGGKRKDFPNIYQQASPIAHVHRDTPPTFLFHGRLDRLVPTDHAVDYHKALLDHNIDTELHWLGLRGHMTSFIFRGSAMHAAEAFIAKHLQ